MNQMRRESKDPNLPSQRRKKELFISHRNFIMSPLRLSDHVVQNSQTGEQMTHWDMINKATKFEFSLFNMSQCAFAFVPRDRLAVKFPIRSKKFDLKTNI